MSELRRTPLHQTHVDAKARMVPFGGWDMPVQYGGILKEHEAVRTAAGLFDISHMGEIFITGDDAERYLNHVLTNDVSLLAPGQGLYSLLCNQDGGVIDDLYVFKLAADRFFLVVNASRTEEDFSWLLQHKDGFGVVVRNVSEAYAAVALQGPNTAAILSGCIAGDLPTRNHIGHFDLWGQQVLVSRTGYTGEDGVEIYCSPHFAPQMWHRLLEAGKPFGIAPCGLGARDTLRLEACLPLYGNDLSPARTPLEAGLGAFVAMEKADFIGRPALAAQKEKGVPSRLAAIRMVDPQSPPPRAHYKVFSGGKNLGELCSGSVSPTLRIGIGLAYLPPDAARPGTEVQVEVRGALVPAQVVKKPFVTKKK